MATRIPVLLAAAERGRYRCESADSLEQGLRRLSKNDIDLVLLNLAPPQRGGLEGFLKARTQVLDLVKMEAGKMTVNRQRLEAAAIIDQACRSYQAILGSRRIVRQFDPVPPVYVDRNLLLQVIANLLGNAIKFTKDDGTITFSLRAVRRRAGRFQPAGDRHPGRAGGWGVRARGADGDA